MNPKYIKFITIAQAIASLSKDTSTKVGAIALGPAGDIRAMGYNGMPRGCNDDDLKRTIRPEKYEAVFDFYWRWLQSVGPG